MLDGKIILVDDNEAVLKTLKTVSYTHLDVYKRQGIEYMM